MSVEQKVGQMVMAGIPGPEAGAEAEELIGMYHVGGIILFAENVRSPRQVAQLTAALRRIAREAGAPWPLLVAVDQEGGRVARIRDGVTPLPSQMALGAAGSVDLTRQVAKVNGEELFAMGIHMNMAPVVDVNSNPKNPVIGVRSFGESPERVAEMGAAYVRGLQEAGVLAVAKHFPGHGDTDVDSHLALPTVAHDRRRLDEVELVPFRAAMDAGVDAIMTAHITFPQVDPTPGLPSTLSERVLTGLLRKELGFSGLIVTDALEMRGVSDRFGLPEAAVMAVKAGADIALIAQSAFNDDAKRAVEALAEAVREGDIPMARVDASLARIAAAKGRLPVAESEPGRLRTPASLEVVGRAARKAITVVRDKSGRLPLGEVGAGSVVVVGPRAAAETMAGALSARLRREVMTCAFDGEPTAAEIDAALAGARQADTVVAVTFQAMLQPAQAELVRRLADVQANLVVVGGDAPYDLSLFPQISTYVAAYGTGALSLQAAADVLLGRAKAEGRLPVTLPGV